MAGRTISAGYTVGIVLAEADNPVTVTTTGGITVADNVALATSGTVGWTIGNAGTIAATGTSASSVGILIAGNAGANITNEATGAISGGQLGVYGAGVSTLANAGSIVATGATSAEAVRFGGGSVGNSGSIRGTRYGVYLVGNGDVTNTGSISGVSTAGVVLNTSGTVTNSGAAASITGGNIGVYLYGTGTLINSGSVANTGTAGYGVRMRGGGFIHNQADGQITGGRVGIAALGTVASMMLNEGGVAGGVYGAAMVGTPAAFTNAATGTVTGGSVGVLAAAGGVVTNAGSVTARFGILTTSVAATAVNSGSIHSTGHFIGQKSETVGAGIQLRAGGTIINQGGTISGYWIGAQIGSFNSENPNGGAVFNSGLITANDPGISGAAVWFKGAGVITNAVGGTIAGGPFGIVSYNTVTVINRGHIGGEQHAVFTSVAGNGDRIIVYPGASFSGTVLGDKAGVAVPTGVLQLGSDAAAGTITGFGTKYISFARVEVDAGATWALGGVVDSGQTVALGAGSNLTLADPLAMGGVITGFASTTGLVLGGISDVTGAVLGAENVLTVTRGGGGTIALRFDPGQVFPPGSFGFSASGGGTALSAPCFALGTRIATARGEVAVEALSAGTRVLRAGGGSAEVLWVGHRRVDCAHHPRPQEVWPVRVAAGAFARGVPGRDLWLSPDHAVFVGGVLIPVRHLENGCTIRQERVDSVTYFHVELAAHDVLLAEGLACESYLDTGNRGAFANGGGAMMLHADFARGRWAAASCAPLVEAGPALAAARTRLLARAGALGHRRSLDPAIAVPGALAVHEAGRRWEAMLPDDIRAVAIVSRGWVPAAVDPDGADTRRLGVGLTRITLDDEVLGLDDPRLGAGWHAAERGWRWTDGHGWVHPRGARRLGFFVAAAGQYWAAA